MVWLLERIFFLNLKLNKPVAKSNYRDYIYIYIYIYILDALKARNAMH
jgi:hypothetical protein